MKLYVVRESTPDPDKWSMWSEWSLVIAADETQARQLTDEGPHTPACEIPLSKAMHLVTMSEPNHGEDI